MQIHKSQILPKKSNFAKKGNFGTKKLSNFEIHKTEKVEDTELPTILLNPSLLES